MSCRHDKRSIDAVVPPRSDEEPAWCRNCGALWTKIPFGGWGWAHHLNDKEAPTLMNILSKQLQKEAQEIQYLKDAQEALENIEAKGISTDEEDLQDPQYDLNTSGTHLVATLAKMAQSMMNNDNIRALVLIVSAKPGALKKPGPLEAVYVRHGFPAAARELTEALPRIEANLAWCEKKASKEEEH